MPLASRGLHKKPQVSQSENPYPEASSALSAFVALGSPRGPRPQWGLECAVLFVGPFVLEPAETQTCDRSMSGLP